VTTPSGEGPHHNGNAITPAEWLAYLFLAGVVLVGIVLSRVNEAAYRGSYVREDGVLEYFTAIMLFATGVYCIRRLLRHPAPRPALFIASNLAIIVLMFFGAGEEISWGQRIFGIETNEFFAQHNRQEEMNLHNLSVGGVNINKLIFGKMLVLFLIAYYLVLPWLYRRRTWATRFADWAYLPVPKVHHGLSMLAIGLAITLVASSKRGELNEVALGVYFFLTIVLPQNRARLNGTSGDDR
jgi:hypothetical protein